MRERMAPSDHGLGFVTQLDPARLAAIVRPVLHTGISLRGRVGPLLKAVDEALAKKFEDGAIAEKLIRQFRATREIRISLTTIAYKKYGPASRAIFSRLREPALNRLGYAPRVGVVRRQEQQDDSPWLLVNDQPHCAVRMIPPDTIFLKFRPDDLPLAAEGARGWIAPDGEEGTVVPRHLQPDVEEARLASWTPLEYAIEFASREIRRIAGRLLTADAVETDLAFLAEHETNLVLAVARASTPDQLARIMRELLREQLSIGDIATIMERIATFDRVVADEWALEILEDRLPVHPRGPRDMRSFNAQKRACKRCSNMLPCSMHSG